MVEKKGYKQTEIGSIPEDWEVKRLSVVADVIGGGTPSTSNLSFWNGYINWFTPTEVGKSKFISESERKITNEGLQSSSAKMLPIGTILLTSRATIGDVSILKNEGCTNQGFQSLIAKKDVNNEYLYYKLLTIKNIIISLASGSTFLEISPNKLRQIEISIPILLEQTAIAAVLSDMDEYIASLERLITKKKALKQGAMQKLLSPQITQIDAEKKISENQRKSADKNWEEKKLGEIGIFYKGCLFSKNDITPDGQNFCIHYGELFTKYNEVINYCYSKTNLRSNSISIKGDILFPASDVTPTGLGRCSSLMVDSVILGGDIIYFRPNKNYHSPFLSYVINHNKSAIIELVTGTTVKHISASQLKTISINIPKSLAEQTAIATILSDMDAEIEALQAKLSKAKLVKQGAMQELLTGKKRLLVNHKGTQRISQSNTKKITKKKP